MRISVFTVASVLFAFGASVLASAEASAASRGKRVAERSRPAIQSGMASWYQYGTRTASGARFNPNGMTAAHRTLPFGTRVLVSNRRTGRSVALTINDRGPFIRGRVIDVSRGAAHQLGMTSTGVAPVTILAMQ